MKLPPRIDLPLRIALGVIFGTAMFWMIRLAGWLNSLTTQRPPFYWTMNHISAWVVAVAVFFVVLNQTKN